MALPTGSDFVGMGVKTGNWGPLLTGGKGYDPNYNAPAQFPKMTPAAAPAAAANPADPSAAYYASMIAETRKQNALLAQQIAAAPKLIKYDTAGAAASSMSEATQYQTPLYTQKLNDYLAKSAIAREAEQRHATESITDATDQLAANLKTSQITGERATADTATKIGEANYQEGNFLDTSGNQADAARAALEGNLGASGTAESGLGTQKLDQQQIAQAADSKQNVHQFEQTKKVADLFKTRTLEDLARSDATNTLQTDKTTGRIKLNLDDYLATDKINEATTRSDLELQRQGAILVDSTTRQQNKANAFIASLVQSGARPQDIELAAKIYGGHA